MTTLLILLSLLWGTLVGHATHWALHQRWTGPLYRAHMHHHGTAYPVRDLLGPGPYRSSGSASGNLWFPPLVVPPLLAWLLVIRALGHAWWPSLAVLLAVGIAHSVVHDALHVTGGLGDRMPRLRALHFEHHRRPDRNFGIVCFVWDRVFGTYRPPR